MDSTLSQDGSGVDGFDIEGATEPFINAGRGKFAADCCSRLGPVFLVIFVRRPSVNVCGNVCNYANASRTSPILASRPPNRSSCHKWSAPTPPQSDAQKRKGLLVSGAIESPKQAQESTRPVQQDDLTKTSASPHHTRMFDASVHRASKLAARLGILPSCACTSVRN